MIISIHQPNFLPWYQYFEKIKNSDIFIILGHCQFEKNNYQNRFYFTDMWQTMSVNKGNELIINKKYTQPEYDWVKIKKRLFKYAKKLDYFDNCINESLFYTNVNLIKKICNLLDVKTQIIYDEPTNLNSSERLLQLCIKHKASVYLSGPSGKTYLDTNIFQQNNISVDFFHSDNKKHILEIL